MTPEDMQALWASHCRYEFELRDVEGALSTMVDDPYLWNIPTLCGGRGQDGMRHYYRDNFVGTMPADAAISSVSLTVGDDQIAEEVILTFTHDREMPWLLPGIPPTGRRVEIPQLAVVAVRDGKIAHEHIWWDQASVLAQVGLLDPQRVPAFGADTATRLRDLPPL
jgi:carboxymethylenebutenolidase